MTKREERLMRAAAEAADSLDFYHRELDGLLPMDTRRLNALVAALRPYVRRGLLTQHWRDEYPDVLGVADTRPTDAASGAA